MARNEAASELIGGRLRLLRTKEGRGSALWLTGEAGSGITRMLTEASLIAQTCGS